MIWEQRVWWFEWRDGMRAAQAVGRAPDRPAGRVAVAVGHAAVAVGHATDRRAGPDRRVAARPGCRDRRGDRTLLPA